MDRDVPYCYVNDFGEPVVRTCCCPRCIKVLKSFIILSLGSKPAEVGSVCERR
jgi:hypothetical protein